MSTQDDAFLAQLRATFRIEADEHLQTIRGGLLELEKTPAGEPSGPVVENVFRAAHSLKGAARAVDLTRIESLCQLLEEVFSSWKRGESDPARETLDGLHQVLDAVNSALAPAGSGEEGAGPDLSSLRQSLRQPRFAMRRRSSATAGERPTSNSSALTAAEPAAGSGAVAYRAEGGETVRIGVAKLEARLLESEEMLTAKLTAAQRVADLHELGERLRACRDAWSGVEPDLRELRQQNEREHSDSGAAGALTRLLACVDSSLDVLKSTESKVAALGRVAEQDRIMVSKLVDDLLEESKKLLLLPFSTMAAAFPKLVRDLCRDQGKEADLAIRGDDIEIDKRILEEVKDPLIHLLRNSIDHGIELPHERARRGKPARAKITIDVSQIDGSKVQLLIADDGAGIDVDKVKNAALKLHVVSPEEARQLDEAQARALIFRSSVSTSPMITQVSGRGLGLAIVQERVEKLGGEVAVESRIGEGTVFRLVIPAVRATFRGILVQTAGQLVVIPTVQVECVAQVKADDIRTVEGRETVVLGERAVALVQLEDVLELPVVQHRDPPAAARPVIVLGSGDQRVAFAVDAVLDEQEVLVKPLRKPLSRVRNVAAATVLGSGQVVPILNVPDLLKSARSKGGAAKPAGTAATEAADTTILVAEDSITSRMLIKGILEAAGYRVKTAVDGAEAFTALRAEHFDLLVSDVEMPRLNGFDLTARIRADRHLQELPVVLVTALETPEHRERGIDVGANAYLVKSSFDQSNLLEAVRRLI